MHLPYCLCSLHFDLFISIQKPAALDGSHRITTQWLASWALNLTRAFFHCRIRGGPQAPEAIVLMSAGSQSNTFQAVATKRESRFLPSRTLLVFDLWH